MTTATWAAGGCAAGRYVRLVGGRVVREEGRRLCGERPRPVRTTFPSSEPSGPALWSESAWSQAFLVGVSLESGLFGRSQLGVSAFRSEAAWSQRFPAGAGHSARSTAERAGAGRSEPGRAGAGRSGPLRPAPARSGSLRPAPPWSERSCVGAGFGVLVMWALFRPRFGSFRSPWCCYGHARPKCAKWPKK